VGGEPTRTVAKANQRRRGEMVERSFAHILDRDGMRRAWLRGREIVHKRYLIHVDGFNLGVLMRALHGQGTPREAADACAAFIFVLRTDDLLVLGLIAVIDDQYAALVVTIGQRQPRTEKRTSSTGC
jgi:transposase